MMIELSDEHVTNLIEFLNYLTEHYVTFINKAEALYSSSSQLQDEYSKEFTKAISNIIHKSEDMKKRIIDVQDKIINQIEEDENNATLMANLAIAKNLIEDNKPL